jgi:hypothetical protein
MQWKFQSDPCPYFLMQGLRVAIEAHQLDQFIERFYAERAQMAPSDRESACNLQ